MARPTKLTQEVQDAICTAIRHGATYQAAAEAAGISYETFNEWRKDARPKYVKFSDAVRRSESDAMLDLLAKIEKAGANDWRSSAWILERRFRKDFGQAVDVTSAGEKVKVLIEYAGNDVDDTTAEPARGADADQAEPQEV